METMTKTAVIRPSAAISPSATRRPSSATAHRRRVFRQKIPAERWHFAPRGLRATPLTSAITMAGIGATPARSGAASTALTATNAEKQQAGHDAGTDVRHASRRPGLRDSQGRIVAQSVKARAIARAPADLSGRDRVPLFQSVLLIGARSSSFKSNRIGSLGRVAGGSARKSSPAVDFAKICTDRKFVKNRKTISISPRR